VANNLLAMTTALGHKRRQMQAMETYGLKKSVLAKFIVSVAKAAGCPLRDLHVGCGYPTYNSTFKGFSGSGGVPTKSGFKALQRVLPGRVHPVDEYNTTQMCRTCKSKLHTAYVYPIGEGPPRAIRGLKLCRSDVCLDLQRMRQAERVRGTLKSVPFTDHLEDKAHLGASGPNPSAVPTSRDGNAADNIMDKANGVEHEALKRPTARDKAAEAEAKAARAREKELKKKEKLAAAARAASSVGIDKMTVAQLDALLAGLDKKWPGSKMLIKQKRAHMLDVRGAMGDEWETRILVLEDPPLPKWGTRRTRT